MESLRLGVGEIVEVPRNSRVRVKARIVPWKQAEFWNAQSCQVRGRVGLSSLIYDSGNSASQVDKSQFRRLVALIFSHDS